MTYLHDLNTYLHQSSLLIQAYPTAKISSKYSLPKKPAISKTSKPSVTEPQPADSTVSAGATAQGKEKREPSAILTLKTFHPETGICLKYRTDKAQEVGRLIGGLGRLAKGETIELPTTTMTNTAGSGDKMDLDDPAPASTGSKAELAPQQAQTQPQPQSTGGKKKKKGKK